MNLIARVGRGREMEACGLSIDVLETVGLCSYTGCELLLVGVSGYFCISLLGCFKWCVFFYS